MKSFVVPGGILLLATAVLAHSGWLTLALPALSFLYYCAIFGGMLLAWRFHSSRIFLSLLVLFLAEQALSLFSTQGQLAPTIVRAVAVLVPVNFVLIAKMQERTFTVASVAPVALFLFVQSMAVAVLCSVAEQKPSPNLHRLAAQSLPRYALIVLVSAAIFLAVQFLVHRKPVNSALLWSLGASSLAVHFTGSPRISTLYWAAAGSILAASIVENSYLLAYHDELTSLPSRRAFNDALLRLQNPYSIAAVDIDHFKRFNDTHGHDTGDQVLRLVAANLARVTGGGQAYRCGGEEFIILFPGRTAADVTGHLEQLRKGIESSEFRMRGVDRRQVPRGPDRRNLRTRSRTSKGRAIRQLAERPAAPLSVTVSIGLAASGRAGQNPEVVLKAADKALYRAKANGRNRLEMASPVRGSQARAAGIA